MSGGGAQRVVLNVIKHLDKNHFQSILLLVNNEQADYIHDIPVNMIVYNLRVKRARFAVPELLYYIGKLKPDVIFSTLDYINILTLITTKFLLYNPKIIIREIFSTKHDIFGSRYPRSSEMIRKFLYKNVSKIICQSDSIRKDLITGYNLPEDKFIRIYNPVDVKEIKEKALIDPNPFDVYKKNIVGMGRLCHQKGFDLLIPAIARIKNVIPNIHLTILGKGDRLTQLQSVVHELNIEHFVTFAGFIENPYPYLWNADLFVLPSRFEGLSNSFLEALACGVTVVAVDGTEGTKEVIRNGINGWIVKSEDIDALVDGIIFALSNPLALSGDSIRRFAESEFGVKTILSQYETVFK